MRKRSEIAPGLHRLLGGVVNSYTIEYASGSGWPLVLLDCGLPPVAGLLRPAPVAGRRHPGAAHARHTLGHCAFLLERDGSTVFTGDAVLHVAGRITVPIPLALNEDRAAVLDSVARLARLHCTAAAFGTGGPIHDHATVRLRAAAERLARSCEPPREEMC